MAVHRRLPDVIVLSMQDSKWAKRTANGGDSASFPDFR
jgi:hypothetical protein